jgi:hypothetical protein
MANNKEETKQVYLSPLLGKKRKLSLLLMMEKGFVLLSKISLPWTFKYLSQDAQPCGHSRSNP